MIFMFLSEFVNKYYIEPIVEGTGYNVVNTVTYLAILVLAVFLVFKALNKMNIDLNRDLWINLLPFVFLGGVVRALMDIGFFDSLGVFRYLFTSPFVFFMVFLMAFIPLVIVNRFDLKIRYLGLFGVALLIVFSVGIISNVSEFGFFSLIIGLAILGCFLTYLILVLLGFDEFKDIVNWSPIFSHSLDASATALAIGFIGGYGEQHVLPSLLFEHLSVFAFIPLKLALAAAAVYYVNEVFSNDWKWILKFTILVVGLGPGVRNALIVLMGV